MPELPEVETLVRDLKQAGLAGRRVIEVGVFWPRTVGAPSVSAFREGLKNRVIKEVSRRGKYVVLALSGGATVLVHLRMTGRIELCDPDQARDLHQHLVLSLDDQRELRFRDTRKFGRWYLLADPAARLGRLGPEPLDAGLTLEGFSGLLRARRGMLKPLLLDQEFLAGLGNIYVDEALWDARLHPRCLASALNAAQGSTLLRSIRRVLHRGIRGQGTTLGSGTGNFRSLGGRRGTNQEHLRVFRRTGKPCPRCGSPIVRIKVAQRSTHVCPRCQPAPLPACAGRPEAAGNRAGAALPNAPRSSRARPRHSGGRRGRARRETRAG